jgi:gluconolactonase
MRLYSHRPLSMNRLPSWTLSRWTVAALLAPLLGCGAGGGADTANDPTDNDALSPFGNPSANNSANTGGSGAANGNTTPTGSGATPPAQNAAAGGTQTPASAAGNGSNEGSNIGGIAPGNNNGAAPGSGGTAGANAGGAADPQDDQDPNETPPASGPAAVGRVGAELCPQGPFSAPLPASPQVTKLFSVGENNFFNFEGPVWVNGALYFSEIGSGNNPPPSRINRFVPGGMFERGVIENTGSNGLAVNAQGNLIAATHDVGAISTFAVPGGARGQLGAQNFNGTRFNSPNDLVQRADGNVYFTDPSFQAPGNPQGTTRVYRVPPQGAATVVDATLSNPNGITLSPDGNTLYVTSASGFRRYTLAADGTPSAGATINLADGLQTPDGMAVDCAGNVYTIEHSRRLIRAFDAAGNELGRFGGPQAFDRDITNMAFGGPNRTTLFVTTLTQGTEGGLFSVELNIPGLPY